MSQFDSKYKGIETFLYEDLRCGLAHQLRPKNRITLASIKDKEQHKYLHLHEGEKSKFYYLIIEAFYSDFVQACNLVIKKIENESNNEIGQNKRKKNIYFSGKTSFRIDPSSGSIIELEIK